MMCIRSYFASVFTAVYSVTRLRYWTTAALYSVYDVIFVCQVLYFHESPFWGSIQILQMLINCLSVFLPLHLLFWLAFSKWLCFMQCETWLNSIEGYITRLMIIIRYMEIYRRILAQLMYCDGLMSCETSCIHQAEKPNHRRHCFFTRWKLRLPWLLTYFLWVMGQSSLILLEPLFYILKSDSILWSSWQGQESAR